MRAGGDGVREQGRLGGELTPHRRWVDKLATKLRNDATPSSRSTLADLEWHQPSATPRWLAMRCSRRAGRSGAFLDRNKRAAEGRPSIGHTADASGLLRGRNLGATEFRLPERSDRMADEV